MAIMSAGILMYRHGDAGLDVLLVHPGGPFWRNRDLGAWSIPKGELQDGEDQEAAARREFAEELGIAATGGCGRSARCASAAARSFWPMRWKAPWTRTPCAATKSRSNGRRGAAVFSKFPKSTGPSGSRCRWRARRFSPASDRFSIVLRGFSAAPVADPRAYSARLAARQDRLQMTGEQFRDPGPVEMIGVEIEARFIQLG